MFGGAFWDVYMGIEGGYAPAVAPSVAGDYPAKVTVEPVGASQVTLQLVGAIKNTVEPVGPSQVTVEREN